MVVPQAVRRVVPPLLNDFVSLQKDTALVASVGLVEALRQAQVYSSFNFNFTSYLVAAAFFVALTIPLARLTDWLGRRYARARAGGGQMTALLRVENLRKAYGDKVVLRDVTLDVAQHDVVCLIGASGSGKSTLLRCLNLLETVDDGGIWFEGEEITDPRVDARRVRGRMGMVFQAYNLFPHMTVLDNVTLAPRRVHGTSRAEAEARARELLGRFGLADKADEHPDRLSGGQQQRAALARALATDPALVLLDEVTSALDPELVGEVLDILRDLAAGGTTMVLATHEMAFARDVATQVCFLDEGRILERGPPDADLRAPTRGADPAVPAPGPALRIPGVYLHGQLAHAPESDLSAAAPSLRAATLAVLDPCPLGVMRAIVVRSWTRSHDAPRTRPAVAWRAPPPGPCGTPGRVTAGAMIAAMTYELGQGTGPLGASGSWRSPGSAPGRTPR